MHQAPAVLTQVLVWKEPIEPIRVEPASGPVRDHALARAEQPRVVADWRASSAEPELRFPGEELLIGGIAKLLREQEFATQFHEGENANIHIQLVGNRVILVVIFDSDSSLGLVRLRVRSATDELNRVFDAVQKKATQPGHDSPFAEITDDDIDNLFND